ATDLAPLKAQIQTLEKRIHGIPPAKAVDLAPVSSQIKHLEQRIEKLPQPKPVDLTPVNTQLRFLEQRIGSLSRPQAVDLSGVDKRLETIEAKIGKLSQRAATPARKTTAPRKNRPAAPKAKREAPRILSAALYGKKDNLKLISGVGPKLERLLNKNGVYYFWQVAKWNKRDINVIDERMDTFKGRIERDDWVSQAKDLRRQPDAARMPANP
ncbi:MAG: hypothetical protein HKN35_14400, partial [Woeseia sp.]|nr:hypothetical protein [Woeseia sp.]